MAFEFGSRRGTSIDISDEIRASGLPLSEPEQGHFDAFDLVYRSLCAVLYNYVPMSGHPGGSISSGRFVTALLFETMDYDLSSPDRPDADVISYAAGHKALGLYAMWALRNEIARIAAPELLACEDRLQLRLEDLLGFRRNPVTSTPLFKKFASKALDGHPTPQTPFVKLSTGASGVGVSTSLGLAYGARDFYGADAPRVHLVEGEGGMTPGRVGEAMAAAGTASLDNALMHIDWNQASIDSNHVCRDGDTPGDYVQWTPMEFAWLHDWNVVYVADGKDIQQVVAAQRAAMKITTGQPTAIVYRTVKGYRYGIEGRASHGAGHKLCSDAFHEAVSPLKEILPDALPTCCEDEQRCQGGEAGAAVREECFYEVLGIVRKALESSPEMVETLAGRLKAARGRLDVAGRGPRDGAPTVEKVYELAGDGTTPVPENLVLEAGTSSTLRGELGKVLNHYNHASGGALIAASADLLGSTSVNKVGDGFGEGYWHATSNPGTRLLSLGGICEDAMAGILTGASSMGHNIGVGSSYGAFIAPLGHIAVRLHSIGCQAKHDMTGQPYRTMFLVCAHAGLKTGEDGPTHADPQPLQLLQGNFPAGTMITLTPWDPQEMWPLVTAALARRPAVIAPFVTRPNETILDREGLGLAPASAAAAGLYKLREASGKADGTVVLQGSGVTYAFVETALPLLLEQGVNLDVYYVSSAELFDAQAADVKASLFPEAVAMDAMGITGFTLPTMARWVRSDLGLSMTQHPFQKGHFLGSGQADMVLAEAEMDGASQAAGVKRYLDAKVST